MPTALIVNVLTPKGSLIADYLNRNGITIYGVDRAQPNGKEKAYTYFRLDLRRRDNLELLFNVSKPEAVIYCWEGLRDVLSSPDFNVIAFWQILLQMLGRDIKKIILCLDEVCEKPETLDQLSQLSLYHLIEIFADQYHIEASIISSKDNLLKEIKKTLITKGGETVG